MRALFGLFACLVLEAALASGQAAPTVAAASDLRFALDEIVAAYARETGVMVRVTYGSSGDAARQIRAGCAVRRLLVRRRGVRLAPRLEGPDRRRGKLYRVGRLVLFAATGSPVQVDERLADLRRASEDGRLRKLAIANPAHAPYGRAAREVLESLGLWQAVEKKLVFGENVSQAAQFAASGSAEAGIFALSLAIAPGLAGRGRYVVLPGSLHRPLRQRMVLLKRGGEAGRRFYEFLQQPASRAILRRYGFEVPAD